MAASETALGLRGEVVYLYAFDVAYEITTANVQQVLARKPTPLGVQWDRTVPRVARFYRPLAIELETLTLAAPQRLPVRVQVRIYEVGVITVVLRVAVQSDHLLDLLPFHRPQLENGASLDQAAADLCVRVCQSLQDCLARPSPVTEPEAYTIFCLTDLGQADDTSQWLAAHQRAIAGLLTETTSDRLSDGQVTEVLRLARSFEKTDLVIVDWDAALVVDLGGYVEDVLYVLELANVQLEEFRAIDHALDNYLNRAYDDLSGRVGLWLGVPRALRRDLQRFRIDVTKLADEVSHISKLIGDWHLARVYVNARERFYLDQWRSSADQRLSQLNQLYRVVHTETNERRMLYLEVLIAIFFAIDLATIFLFRK